MAVWDCAEREREEERGVNFIPGSFLSVTYGFFAFKKYNTDNSIIYTKRDASPCPRAVRPKTSGRLTRSGWTFGHTFRNSGSGMVLPTWGYSAPMSGVSRKRQAMSTFLSNSTARGPSWILSISRMISLTSLASRWILLKRMD